ncbi:hypothetical protein F4680DRAFT_430115 [Xylaria scruposa]|nr:hypothetical protein F4680DRAFT_430115 [Xylaria scruposa]
MYDPRFSPSIDSIVKEDSGFHHRQDVRSCEADTDSNLNQAPPMPSQTSLSTHSHLTRSSGSNRSYQKVFGSRPSKFQTLRKAWYYGWVAESFGCSLAVIALSAMIIALRLHDNRPLTTWPFSISINSFIAVFGVILKAGLTVPLSEGISQLKWKWFEKQRRKLIDLNEFDAASRGPWGSFLFLLSTCPSLPLLYPWNLVKFPFDWNADHNPGYFAKFAALLTVLAVAVDPFTQQVVVYTDCPHISADEYSLVARTNHYTTTGSVAIKKARGRSLHYLEDKFYNLDSSMAVAINTGMVNPPQDIPSLIATDCKSGNCTFGTLASVGLCRSCEDITSQFRNITRDGDKFLNFTIPDNSSGFGDLFIDRDYQFRTKTSKSDFFQIRIAMGPSFDYPSTPLSAFQCSITPCVRKYSSFISKNILSEVDLSSTPIGHNWNNVIAGLDIPDSPTYLLATSRTPRNGSETGCASSDKESPGLVEVALANIDAAPQYGKSNETTWYPEDCVWTFSSGAQAAIAVGLSTELTDLSLKTLGEDPGQHLGQLIAARTMWRNGTMDLAHINDYMRKLVDVMTATMRNNGLQDEYARGQVQVKDTCVTVRWAWLAYPAALIGLTIIFLALLILQGPSGSSSRAWKSSILAPLFISMDEATYDPNYYDMSTYEMDQLAEQIHTQLIRDPTGKAKFL